MTEQKHSDEEVFFAEMLLALSRALRIAILMRDSHCEQWHELTREDIDAWIGETSAILGVDPSRAEDSEAMQNFLAWRASELRRMKYDEYLRTGEWKDVRYFALHRAGHRCQTCNGKRGGLHVHHRSYERRGHERLDDVTVLCAGCHKAFHETRRLER